MLYFYCFLNRMPMQSEKVWGTHSLQKVDNPDGHYGKVKYKVKITLPLKTDTFPKNVLKDDANKMI